LPARLGSQRGFI